MEKQSFKISPLHGKMSAIRKSLYANKFTLVELLVVIAIIGILASMLLPALKSARDLAKGANCLSNLKQLGYASEMYMSDWGYFVPYSQPVGASTVYWFGTGGNGLLDPYFPNNKKNLGYGSLDPAKNSPLACPSETNVIGTGNGTATLGQNDYIDGFRVLSFTLPSRLFTFADAGFAQISSTDRFRYRHSNGVNVVYADSHADMRKFGSFVFGRNPFMRASGYESNADTDAL